MNLSFLPNLITVIRLMLVLPIAFLLIDGEYVFALVLFTLAGISDGLDGLLARMFGWESAFGKLIDPLADKLLMITTALVMGWLDGLPMLLAMLMVAKDLAVLGGVFAYTTLAGFPKISPTILGKVTTAAQILLLVFALANLAVPSLLPAALFEFWIWFAALLTLADGISYLWLWTDRLARDPRWQETI